jgi:hypothetical protein
VVQVESNETEAALLSDATVEPGARSRPWRDLRQAPLRKDCFSDHRQRPQNSIGHIERAPGEVGYGAHGDLRWRWTRLHAPPP